VRSTVPKATSSGSPVHSGSTPRFTLADNHDTGNLLLCGMMEWILVRNRCMCSGSFIISRGAPLDHQAGALFLRIENNYFPPSLPPAHRIVRNPPL
jgi:hypothetical protein